MIDLYLIILMYRIIWLKYQHYLMYHKILADMYWLCPNIGNMSKVRLYWLCRAYHVLACVWNCTFCWGWTRFTICMIIWVNTANVGFMLPIIGKSNLSTYIEILSSFRSGSLTWNFYKMMVSHFIKCVHMCDGNKWRKFKL